MLHGREEKDEPIIKGLDGLSDSNPLWVRRWFKKIVVEIVKHPETRIEVIPNVLKEAFDELDSGRINREEEQRFTQRLKLHPHDYEDHIRTGILAKLLNKDKGDLVHWYETYEDIYAESKQSSKKRKTYSIKTENLNLDKYKNLLLKKLKDSLEITGFNIAVLESELSEHNTISRMVKPSHGVVRCMKVCKVAKDKE